MDIKKNKTRGIFVLSVLIILCLCVASIISYFMPNKSVEAIADLSDATNIGELLLNDYTTRADKMVFNGSNLELLYKQLTGTATYDKVVELSENTLNSDNFRTNNDGKDITVTINGLVWNATYLSRNRDGDPIVTLWLRILISCHLLIGRQNGMIIQILTMVYIPQICTELAR